MDTTTSKFIRRAGLLFFGLALGFSVRAQQPVLDAYGFSPIALNPALAGAKGYFNLNAVLFNQLNGTFRPNQVGQVLSAEGVFANGKTGYGLQGFNSSLANFPSSGITLGGSHGFSLPNAWQLRAGVQVVGRFRPFFNSGFDNRRVLDPSIGVGALLSRENAFLGISKPSLGRRQPLFDPRVHPLIAHVGYLVDLGEQKWYLSAVYLRGESGSTSQQGIHLDTKFWIGDRLGLGGSVRNEQNESSKTPWKFVGWGEFRVSEGIRLGLSYDPRPQSLYPANFQVANTPGQIQLFFRYEGFKSGVQTSIFDFM